MLRLLGAMVLAGVFSACSTPKKSGMGALKISPQSRYIMEVTDLVNKQWNRYRQERATHAAFGGMEVVYWVNKKGKLDKMRVVAAKGASPDLIRLTTSAIRDVKLPRMPADVIASLTPKDEGVLKLMYKAYIPPTKSSTGPAPAANLTPQERVEHEVRAEWNKENVRNLGYGPGVNPLDLKETPTARYGKLVVGRLKRQWSLYLLQSKVRPVGELDLAFYVNSAGKVENLKASPLAGCDPRLTEITLRAARDAEIPPMPAEVHRMLLVKNQGRLKILFHARNR